MPPKGNPRVSPPTKINPRAQPGTLNKPRPAPSPTSRPRGKPKTPAPSPAALLAQNALDKKLRAILVPFCKFHHNHAFPAEPQPGNIANLAKKGAKKDKTARKMNGNPAMKILLEEGAKKMSRPVWIQGELEELYPKYFDDFCGGRPVPTRQKEIMYSFFLAWVKGMQQFMKEEAEKRKGDDGKMLRSKL